MTTYHLFRTVIIGALLALSPNAASAFSLDEVEQDVVSKYPSVTQLSTSTVANVQATSKNVVLFDVREEDEFLVSHLPGAIRVDPDMSEADFLKQYASMVQGKQVVFYCSVGVRSSKLAGLVGEQLKAVGAVQTANMSGGIFRWHNEKRVLMSTSGKVDLVHPYNSKWGALVDRKPKISYTPIP
ncbi:MAG: rhodanese-like domain-containing protein [Anderseniella sp.]